MKVLQINSVCGVGSTGKICVDIAKILKEKGHDCVIAYGRGEATGWDKTYKITSSFGNKLHYLKSRIFDRHGLGSSFETKKFIKYIKKYNPDVIHLHNIHGYYLNYKILFTYLQNYQGKVVWTMHDMWTMTGHCAYSYECEKWYNGCHHCSKLKDYPNALFDNSKKNYVLKKKMFTSIKNLTIVTVSEWLKDEFKKSYFKNSHIDVVHNGIDISLFKPYESDFREKNNLIGKKVLLAVADRWTERKGFSDFLKLAEMLDENTKLVMVGLTEEQKNTLPANIIGITRTENQKQLAELYSTADLFVNLTYSDTFGLVNIESLACGTPVLTYKTGGSPETISEEVGYVVEQGDINKVYKIIKSFNKTKNIKNLCIQHATKFDKKLKFEEYIQIYAKNK